MRALVVIHEPDNGAALVGERLVHHGFELVESLVTTEVGDPTGRADFGDATDYDLIVPMGSSYSVYATNAIGSWINDELEFLRRADACDVPVLGVCFGAQALAAALGGRVVAADAPQVGWHPLTPEPGTGLPEGPWFQWHSDRFDPPPDATVLARDHVGVQAFSVRRHLGVQFHPEVTRAHLQGWIDMGGDEDLRRLGVDPDALLADTGAHEATVRARTDQLVDWFLADIAKL